jgi:S-adenosylmethionine-diacylgycerolhomoserine-N-methlytransferase
MALDPRVAMERMYRHQRHVYDLTRKYYLFGRDRLMRSLPVRAGDQVCEVGCGTARNLIALARRHPDALFCGVDASAPMLETARASIARAGLSDRIRLRHGLAEELDAAAMFGLTRPFDIVIFAYSLSMIPDWPAAISRAVAALRAGGSLAIVDFSDQSGLPRWFAGLLQKWLTLFDVHPRAALLQQIEAEPVAQIAVSSILRGYAVALQCVKAE